MIPKSIDSTQLDRLYFPSYPVDTGRKLNIHKTLRRRPRRLLNVLCMFNLRPVSTGYNYSCLKFRGILESSKLSFSIFPGLQVSKQNQK